jgi:hypothetical protein
MDKLWRDDSLMKERPLYEERTGWAWWVHPLIWITFLPAVIALTELARGISGDQGVEALGSNLLMLALGLGLPLGIYSLMGDLRTRVTEQGIDLRWGFLEVIRKYIPFREIDEALPVTYSPLREFGGWGIRAGGKKKRAWTVRGRRALMLTLKDGTHFYLGSDRPERLVQWVHQGMKRSSE